tara:strand:- start:11632 stop:12165 length:534 start_codon:yes stop_codon:yes gene_type:complete
MHNNNTTDQTETTNLMTPVKGLLVLLGIIIVVAAFIALNTALGIHEFWAGFLFLLYWAGIEHFAWDKLAACVAGAIVGLLMACLVFALPRWLGDAGGLVVLALILVLIYCQVMGWLPVAINLTTMLFLTAGTIPAVQESVNFADAFISLGLAFIYFIGLVWVGMRVMAMKAATPANQ